MYYTLKGREVVECTREDWAAMFEDWATRQIGRTERDGITVSTVFLGLDHGFGAGGPPLVFETMIFGGPHDQDQERCCTYDEAEAMHARFCERAFAVQTPDELATMTSPNLLHVGRKLELD